MDLKAHSPSLFIGEPVTFGQRYTYASDHDMNAMLAPGYFDAMRRRLCPGDTIRVVQMRGKDIKDRGNSVVAFVDCTVLAVEDGVELLAERSPTRVPAARVPTPAPKPASEKYVPADGVVRKARSGYEVKVSGETVATGLEELEAVRIAKGDAPIPA